MSNTERNFVHATFGDGTVCKTKAELDAYLIGAGPFEPIAHGSELDTEICFAVGDLSRDKLEDAAADAGGEWDKWTSKDDLRAMVVGKAREQGGLMLVDDDGNTRTFGFDVPAGPADQTRPRG